MTVKKENEKVEVKNEEVKEGVNKVSEQKNNSKAKENSKESKNEDVKVEKDTNKNVQKEESKAKAKAESKVEAGEDKATKVVEEKEEVVPFERNTRIEKSSITKTLKSLYKNRDKLRFDLAIQRNEVWTLDQKSNLIHSILYGYPVPPVMVQETDDQYIWFLDGKQRLTTIISYISGEFALSKKTPTVFGHSIANFKFADLPEDMQDIITEETIQLIKLKYMTDEERDEMFVRWNSGSSLSKIELTRAMHSDLIEQINHIADLDFFKQDIALTGKARNRFVDQEIILQIAMLLDEGKDNIKGFGSAQISDYVLRLKETNQVLSDSLIGKFEVVSHYLHMALGEFEYAERRKALKKIHVPMIFHIAMKAMDFKVKPNVFGDFVRTFLINTYSTESDYGEACQSGSSKRDNVIIRLHEINRHFDDFMKMIEKTASEKQQVEAVEKFEKKLEKEVQQQEQAKAEELNPKATNKTTDIKGESKSNGRKETSKGKAKEPVNA